MPLGFAEDFYIKINEILNEDEVRSVDISKRSCRFHDENYMDFYPVYSTSACLINCRKKLQLKLCNCTSYFMPNADPELYCDLNGLVCLGKYVEMFRTRKVSQSSFINGFYCPCVDTCDAITIEFVRWVQDVSQQSESGKAELKIILDHLPNELFKRTVVRGKLDLVVSMGGAAGLFVGASLLSFIEIIYYFTIRLFVTVKRKYKQRNQAPDISLGTNMSHPN